MNIGQSIAEHAEEVWYVLVTTFTALITLIVYVYKGTVKRLEKLEDTLVSLTEMVDKDKLEEIDKIVPILQDVVTRDTLVTHCKGMQMTCPQNTKIDQIALDTKAIRANIDKVIQKQEVLRESTLPQEYLRISSYEKEHAKIEQHLKESLIEIKADMKEIRRLIEVQSSNRNGRLDRSGD